MKQFAEKSHIQKVIPHEQNIPYAIYSLENIDSDKRKLDTNQPVTVLSWHLSWPKLHQFTDIPYQAAL